jgi:fused signal recognition particle receptor
MASFLGRIRSALTRTAQQIRERLGDEPDEPIVAADAPAGTSTEPAAKPAAQALQVETLEAVEDALLAADVGLKATTHIIDAIGRERSGSLRERVGAVMRRILLDVHAAPPTDVRPRVILIVGVNGTGKTTTVGKLARFFRQEGRTVVIGAADTFRAAAVEQVAVWADRAGVELVRARMGADPAAVTFDAVVAARAQKGGPTAKGGICARRLADLAAATEP